MNRSTAVVALVAGHAGGVLSRYISPAPVLAQQAQPNSAPLEVRAQRFALVNSDGSVLATFVVDQPKLAGVPVFQTTIRLLDWRGKEIWSAGGDPMRKLASK